GVPRRGRGILLAGGRELGHGLLVLHRGTIRIPLGEALVALRELLLELRGIEEHQSGEVDASLGRVDRILEPGRGQMRDEPAVIEMRVREHEPVDLTRRVGERHAVPDHIVRAALEHATVDELGQRLHDCGIDRALTAWLGGEGGPAPKVVGVMGSHSTRRDDPQYALVAELGWLLARAGFLVATGGGPGLMEAANLGAYLSKHTDRGALDRAIAILNQAPAYESDPAGYIEATRRVRANESDGAVSLGVPSWVYPYEPED